MAAEETTAISRSREVGGRCPATRAASANSTALRTKLSGAATSRRITIGVHLRSAAWRPLERHAQTGTYFIVAARQSVLIEVQPDGVVLGVMQLGRRQHPKSEGIAIGIDGRLFLADEGQNRRARITAYRKNANP